jgi:LysM repeat protein
LAEIYTVKKGDTLSQICEKYKTKYGYGSGYAETTKYMNAVAKLNDIDNVNLIYTGQKIDMDVKNSKPAAKPATSSKPSIKHFGLQSDTDRTVFATWHWSKDHTDHYKCAWYYWVPGNNTWFEGSISDVTSKQSVYNAPANASSVKFKVKPISKKHKVNKKDVVYWTADYSSEKKYSFNANPPSTPPVPTVEIDKYTLTASIDNYDDALASKVFFEIVKDNTVNFSKSDGLSRTKNSASYSCKIEAGGEYKARCRAYNERSQEYSDWSEYSNNVGTIPSTPGEIEYIKALSKTVLQLKWGKATNATSCEVEYTTDSRYFDSSSAVQSVTVNSLEYCEVVGLEPGNTYYFRVRAVNENGKSGWTGVKSAVLGQKPAAPTTWSSTTTAITGEPLTLYWIHNAKDGSKQKYAEIELTIDGVTQTINPPFDAVSDDDEEKTYSYPINTSVYVEGTKILWRVRTAGITGEYGDWSAQRTVDIYAPPTLTIKMTNTAGEEISSLRSFPFYISGIAGPRTQAPIGYNLEIVSNEQYETVDQIGNQTIINEGETVYSKQFDTKETLLVELSAHNIDLENNVTYTVNCTVSMNSGLSASASLEFTVYWADETYGPNAEIAYDPDTLTASIRPYCEEETIEVDDKGNETITTNLVPNITLSVYRREYDGKFVELATGLSNTKSTFTTDPHPALDYARYRIVAIANDTGAVSFYDVPGYPTGENAVIIQWNEAWSNFDTNNEDALENQPWSGSLLKLPYNIDVSDSNKPDVELIEYIGRPHPVSYYGTQLGTTSTWNVEVPKDDINTLYALRRLSIWMGDVYVREPSGSGYWANVTVSFSQKHCAVTIPVTLNVTRVEGGA